MAIKRLSDDRQNEAGRFCKINRYRDLQKQKMTILAHKWLSKWEYSSLLPGNSAIFDD